MEALLITFLQSKKWSLLVKVGLLDPFRFSPEDSRTQFLLFIAFILLMLYAEKRDLFGLQKSSQNLKEDDGLQNNF